MSMIDYTPEECVRWSFLRAIEWGKWPLYTSQIIAPVLLVFLRWPWVVLGFFLANLGWSLIRYRLILPRLAEAAVLFVVLLRWPMSLGIATLIWWRGYPVNAVVCAAWPLVILLLGLATPVRIGRLQPVFMRWIAETPR